MPLSFSPPNLLPLVPISSLTFDQNQKRKRNIDRKKKGPEMKVQCDGCGVEAASVFCCDDEAALCDNCDHRVHRANKLASKHRRFSLLHPSSRSSSAQPPPLCDICQDKRGLLFCKEDRAILCRDCDVPIHTSSDLTKKHTRFLLTGVRLSSAPITSSSAPSEIEVQQADKQITRENNCYSGKAISQEEAGSTCTGSVMSNNSSSISNYLINMLPGWHVEEFFSCDAATGGVPVNAPFTSISSNGFYEGQMNPNGMYEEYPIWANQEQNFHNGFAPKMNTSYPTLERWVPQIQTEFGAKTRHTPYY
ncbi:B-box zinc finger family protein [Rhynchospora pubera]|uniref:B-box zinc finger family protein n=1 Tax=Rhynchospora pubera TaxID=906938 RepID=A0AAV8CWY0_9POAL|nr:B-box zinc finger family protein [Rhynchospora pubera]KAJ4759498.1 B-box zinc finger family protein [Rhynchospora pubera]